MVTSQVETRYQNDMKWPTFDNVLALLTNVIIPLPKLYQTSWLAIDHEAYNILCHVMIMNKNMLGALIWQLP